MTSDELRARGSNRAKRRAESEKAYAAGGEPLRAVPESIPVDVREVMIELLDRAPDGMLTESDIPALEVAARLTLRSREPGVKTGVFSALLVCLGKLGLTPDSRHRIPVTPAAENDDDNPWAKFVQEDKAAKVVRGLFGEKQPLAGVTKKQLAAKIRARGGFPAQPGDDVLLENSAESILEMAGLDAGPEDDGATETEHTGESPDAYMQ